MQQCKSIGCAQTALGRSDFCERCLVEMEIFTLGVQALGGPTEPQQMRSAHVMKTPTAPELLEKAHGHMQDRASTYDAPEGERSMGKTVAAFNAITGHALSETEGWHFMALLKMARAHQGDYRADNHENHVAYAALAGEAAARENQEA